MTRIFFLERNNERIILCALTTEDNKELYETYDMLAECFYDEKVSWVSVPTAPSFNSPPYILAYAPRMVKP